MKTSDLAAIFLAVIAATLLIHGFIRDSWQILLVGVLAAIGAGWILVEPEVSARRAAIAENKAPKTKSEPADDSTRPAPDQIELFVPSSQSSVSSQTQRALEQELKAARDITGELKKEIAKWQTTAIEYVDFLDWVLGLEGLDDKCGAAFRKARVELIGKIAEHGIIEIRPKTGDEFDDRLHIAEGAGDTDNSSPLYINDLEKPGFAIGSRVIRPAKVRLG